MFDIET